MGIEDVRARLMSSLAVALGVGCGPGIEPSDGGEGMGASGPATTDVPSGATATSTSGSSTGMHTDGGVDVDSGMDQPKFDITQHIDLPEPMPPIDCPPQPRPPAEECTAELPVGSHFEFYCVELPDGETCETWTQGFEPTRALEELLTACVGDSDDCQVLSVDAIGCGPLPDFGDQCCAWFIVHPQQCPPEGRPFVVNGNERLATLVERDGWAGDASVPLPPRHRAAIAAAWTEQALAEHASIASFSRFVLQLLACGAPASLVSAAQVAMGEEIEHARLFFSLASRLAGCTLGPAALDVHGSLAGSDDLDAIVLATVREGCIAETISAWRITVAAGRARDPALAAALARVAAQELEHAALAWRLVAWALPRASASLPRRVATTLHDAARHAPRTPALAPEVPDATWRAHGILPPSEHAAVTQHALRELVDPLARTLLGARSSDAASFAVHR